MSKLVPGKLIGLIEQAEAQPTAYTPVLISYLKEEVVPALSCLMTAVDEAADAVLLEDDGGEEVVDEQEVNTATYFYAAELSAVL